MAQDRLAREKEWKQGAEAEQARGGLRTCTLARCQDPVHQLAGDTLQVGVCSVTSQDLQGLGRDRQV